MQIIVLLLATIVDLVVLGGLFGGKKYVELIASMKDKPLSSLFTVGFSAGDMKLLSGFRNKTLAKLTANTQNCTSTA